MLETIWKITPNMKTQNDTAPSIIAFLSFSRKPLGHFCHLGVSKNPKISVTFI